MTIKSNMKMSPVLWTKER